MTSRDRAATGSTRHDGVREARGTVSPGTPGTLPRRDFMAWLGASMALAGVSGCVREPDRTILPYIKTPPDVVPGHATHYATAMELDGYGTGLIVESHDGRPTKIEGNPDHPASLGAAGIHQQAAVLQLYDPNRARTLRVGRKRATWQSVVASLSPARLSRRVGQRGAGLRILLEPTASPLVARMLARVHERYPDARVYFYSPLASSARDQASRAAFGQLVVPQYHLSAAAVVVALDADFLASGPFHLRQAHDLAQRRRSEAHNRLYVAESCPSPTGTLASRRLAATPTELAQISAALMSAIASDPRFESHLALGGASAPTLSPAARVWVAAVASDVIAQAGRCVVIAGDRQPIEVQVAAHMLNAALGGHDTTRYTAAPIIAAGSPAHDIAAFASDLQSGSVDTLVILGGNPCYGAPADLALPQRIRAIPNSVFLGAYDDETARASVWHVPAAHFLESWGDTRAYDGTVAITQPLIAPLYGGHTPAELLALIAGTNAAAYDLLRDAWRTSPETSGTEAWNDALRRGVVSGSALPPVDPALRPGAAAAAFRTLAGAASQQDAIDLVILPSAAVHDGQFANNPWLQELPDPITKLTWGNALQISPVLAERLGLANGDVATVEHDGRSLDAPILVVPGHADASVSLPMGYGRGGAESVARGVGVSATMLRTLASPYLARGIVLRPTGRHVELALTQTHWSLEGRASSVLGEQRGPPTPAGPTGRRRPLTLYEPAAPSATGFGADQWAMAIDLDVCTGCSACVVACQAENNVPVVGRDDVLRSREMHWLRIDRYIEGTPAAPSFAVQPMLCQHCEKAPCEYVCPVNATVHSDDGLNEMIYNRCVGTRFCSNNCPYKVRRFNWFDYNAEIAETERMAKNPEVTVRGRGVMEKCTFCVQRVREAQAAAQLSGAERTGPVITACQQTCPTQAIVFGSLTDPASDVSREFNDPRSFSALAELGTVPRVRYLRRRDSDAAAALGDRDDNGESRGE